MVRPCLQKEKKTKDFSIKLESLPDVGHTCNPSIWRTVQEESEYIGSHRRRGSASERERKKKIHMEFDSLITIVTK